MSIEIKISKKPVEYVKAVSFLEKRMLELKDKKQSELIWILEHPSVYTAGSSYKESELLDKSVRTGATLAPVYSANELLERGITRSGTFNENQTANLPFEIIPRGASNGNEKNGDLVGAGH